MKPRTPNIVRSRYGLFDMFTVVVVASMEGGMATACFLGVFSGQTPVTWYWILLTALISAIFIYFTAVMLCRVVIDTDGGSATVRTLFRPGGRKFFFRDYTGVYLSTDASRLGCVSINDYVRFWCYSWPRRHLFSEGILDIFQRKEVPPETIRVPKADMSVCANTP